MTTPDPDVDTIRQALVELPELCELLPAALITRRPATGAGRPTPASRPPVDLGILCLLDTRDRTDWTSGMEHCDPEGVGVLPYLWGWCRDLEATALDTRPDLPPELPERPTIPTVAEWLLGQLEWASGLPQWPELASGITATHRAVRGAVKAVRDPSPADVPCGICHVGHLTRVPGAQPLWQCLACGHEVTVQAVTLRQAAAITGTSERTLRDWARRRGLLAPVAEGPRRRLYDLGQIRGLIAQSRLRQGA